jgi:hypothetical protein
MKVMIILVMITGKCSNGNGIGGLLNMCPNDAGEVSRSGRPWRPEGDVAMCGNSDFLFRMDINKDMVFLKTSL